MVNESPPAKIAVNAAEQTDGGELSNLHIRRDPPSIVPDHPVLAEG
jgi:hypothetical protein